MARVSFHLILKHLVIMVCSHTSDTEKAFIQIENALKGSTQDDLNHLVNEIKSLYEQALLIQEIASEYNSGAYLD